MKVRSSILACMPKYATFGQATQLPTVFLTVKYALDRAKLRKGDRILIHKAADNIGLAAIQYAHNTGAVIIATETADKHIFLRSLGVELIVASDDYNVLKTELKTLVGDRGIDVALSSSIEEDLIEEWVPLLTQYGTYISTSETSPDIPQHILQARSDVTYELHSFDDMISLDVGRIGDMLNELTKLVEQETIQPLPMKMFEMPTQLVDAFMYLQNKQTVGKAVIVGGEVKRERERE